MELAKIVKLRLGPEAPSGEAGREGQGGGPKALRLGAYAGVLQCHVLIPTRAWGATGH